MTEGVTLAGLSGIATSITTIATWFWGIFGDFVGIIAENDLILWSVILASVSGAIGLVITVIRKFGLRAKR